MFLLTFTSILLIIKKSAQDCLWTLWPLKASDCVLSEEDKKSYTYCCFEKEEGESYGMCNAYSDSSFDKNELQEKYEKYGENSNNFICNDQTVTKQEKPDITWEGCEDISPKKPSDCKMSEEDKAHNYDYCCYESIGGFAGCTLNTEESRQEELEYLKIFELEKSTTYKCTDSEKSGSGFLNISILLIISIILSI